MIYFVVGGVRSGKSAYAEALAKKISPDDVLYVATLSAFDEEMEKRIVRHRRQRPASWHTEEISYEFEAITLDRKVILVDCLSGFVSNIIMANEEVEYEELIGMVLRNVSKLIRAARRSNKEIIIVSNEVGSGVVPASKMGRIFRDALGLANQFVAKQADNVAITTVGIATVLKGKFPE